MGRIAALKPDEKQSLFICKVYFDRPNIHDPKQDHQKRFFSFDYPRERQEPPTIEDCQDEQKLLTFNGYYKMLRWIEKARQDRTFKHAYIYANQLHDEDGRPSEIRLFLPYSTEMGELVVQNFHKPHWKYSIFKLVSYFKSKYVDAPDDMKTIYSRDLDIERENPLTSVTIDERMKQFRGFKYVCEKQAIHRKDPRWKCSLLYANLLSEDGEYIGKWEQPSAPKSTNS